MEENTNSTETTSQESSSVETQTTQETESQETTTQQNESESTNDNSQETSSEESNNSDSGNATETADQKLVRLEKALKDTQAFATKKAQEAAEAKKAQDLKQFEIQKQQVEENHTQLRQGYNDTLKSIKQNKANLLADARAKLLAGEVNPTQFDNYVNQLDANYETLKQELDADYQRAGAYLKSQNAELQKQRLTNFKTENKDFFEKPYMKEVLAECEKAGYTANDFATVKKLAEKVLSAYDAHVKNQNNTTSENNNAKSKLSSVASSGSSAGSTGNNHIYTRSELAEMQKSPAGREKFLKVEKIVFDQMAKGLIQ